MHGNLIAIKSFDASRQRVIAKTEPCELVRVGIDVRDCGVHAASGPGEDGNSDPEAGGGGDPAEIITIADSADLPGKYGEYVGRNSLFDGASGEICDHAHAMDLKVHLDGARIFNAATALKENVAQMTRKVDSVMFCLSKGLGAPVGSMVAGSKAFIKRARIYRRCSARRNAQPV